MKPRLSQVRPEGTAGQYPKVNATADGWDYDVPAGAPGSVSTETAAFTFASADAGRLVIGDSSSTIAATIPTNASDAIPVGSNIDSVQWGAGQVNVVPASGVTLNSKGANSATNGQYAWVRLVKTATDTWVLFGDLAAVVSPSYSSVVLADSPWAYWQGLVDQTSNGRDVTLTGSDTATDSPTASTGNGQGYSFAAGANYLRPAVSLSTSTCTLEAWVYLTATPTTATSIISCASSVGSATADKFLYVGTDGKLHGYVFNGATETIDDPSVLALNAWHHVVVVIGDGGSGKLYVNATQVASNASAGASAAVAQYPFVHSGGTISGTDLTASSAISIAEPAVYTTALTATQVSAHYAAG